MTEKTKTAETPVITDMALKIEHLKGIMAPCVAHETFLDGNLATDCGCTIHTFSKKKSGTAQFKSGELGRLVQSFRLGAAFSYRDFYLAFDAFDDKLRREQVGTYAVDPRSELRKLLMAISDPGTPIAIKRVAHRQVGGIGGDPSLLPTPVLRNGDQVQLVVPLPPRAKGGHLLVLNYSPEANGGVSFLMPSCYAPETLVAPYPVTLPTKESLYPSFPVSIPEGARPIFALWSAAAPSSFLTMPDGTDDRAVSLAPAVLLQLCEVLREDAKTPNSQKFIAFQGYYDVRSPNEADDKLRR